MKPSRYNSSSLSRRLQSFGYAFKGLLHLARTQFNFRFHLIAAIAACCLGAYFGISQVQWVGLVLAIGLVLVAEAMNTALEFFTDLVSPDYNELAGRVKDVAAGAVLIAAVMALAIGFIIFVPHLRLI